MSATAHATQTNEIVEKIILYEESALKADTDHISKANVDVTVDAEDFVVLLADVGKRARVMGYVRDELERLF